MPDASTQTLRGKKLKLIQKKEKKDPIKEALEFSLKMREKISKAQQWAFDKSLGMKELRKRQMTNYIHFEEFAKEFKEKQQPALLVQKEWNDFWSQKDEKFIKEFAIDNEHIFRDSNVENEQYQRRLKLIQKNVKKIHISVYPF